MKGCIGYLLAAIAIWVVITAILFAAGYFDNKSVCVVEYTDGSTARFDCWHAGVKKPFLFSSYTQLEVRFRTPEGDPAEVVLPTASIRSWRVVDKNKGDDK